MCSWTRYAAGGGAPSRRCPTIPTASCRPWRRPTWPPTGSRTRSRRPCAPSPRTSGPPSSWPTWWACPTKRSARPSTCPSAPCSPASTGAVASSGPPPERHREDGPAVTGPHLEEALSAWLDDELAPAARREAALHLEQCAACRDELELVARARAAIRALPVRLPPPRFLEDLLAGAVPVLRPRRRVAWALAAAAAS